jgi:hypothetical protein
MNTRNRFTTALALCALAALAGNFILQRAGAARAYAGDGSVRQFNVTPPLHIAEGQTLRVNFLNAGRRPFEIIPCVFDGDGAHLKTGETIRLLPGQTRSFEITRAEAGRRTDPSALVRAGVHMDGSVRQGDGSVRKYLVVSGEVIEDATGRTSLFVPGLRVGFDPQPDPPAGRGDEAPPAR